MSRVLSIANKLLSIRGRIEVTDERGELAYEARGELAFLSPTWRLHQRGQELASVRQRVFSWAPTWQISAGNDAFEIKRKLLSWTRQCYTVGGPYDGALIQGNLWDLNFKVTHAGSTLATATGKILTLRDRHKVEVLSEADELFVVMAMMVVHLDRRDDRRHSED